MRKVLQTILIFSFIFISFNISAKESEKNRGDLYETIKVTAQKQEDNLQDIPISITVLTSQDIEDKNIESLKDAADYVPNLMIFQHGHPALSTPTTRGVYAPATSLSTSTGLFVDGVPLLMAPGFEDELLDIERIEILKGPQGTIYGTGSEAGVISIITAKPDNNFKGKISGQYGEDEKKQAAINLSGPILKDKLFFSISGNFYEKDGFIEHLDSGKTLDDRKHWSTRAKLRWTPTKKLDSSLIITSRREDSGMGRMNLGDNGSLMFKIPKPEDRKTKVNESFSKTEPETDLQALKLDYSISDKIKLSSITTNWLQKDYMKKDFDGTSKSIRHSDKKNEHGKISQELRLNLDFNSSRLLLGVYGDKTENEIDVEFLSMIPKMNSKSGTDIDGNTYAGFFNFSTSITKKLSITAGLRYETESQDFEDKNLNLKNDESWESITPKLAMEYRFSDNFMTYISAAKGYRSGGFNWAVSNPSYYGTSYDQEELWCYESGLKTNFFNNRLIFNTALFYMDIKDMQVAQGVSPIVNYTSNAAEASSQGIELEASLKPLKGLILSAGFGYTNIEFDKFSDALGDYKGNKAPFAPEYNYNLGCLYRNPVGIFARADMVGYGKTYLDKTNKYSRDSYELVNLKIGYETEYFDIYLYGKNIFDTEYDSKNYFNGFWDVYSDPREIGAQVVLRF